VKETYEMTQNKVKPVSGRHEGAKKAMARNQKGKLCKSDESGDFSPFDLFKMHRMLE
jgi:hypothetical protein